jgi:hypothetical protein
MQFRALIPQGVQPGQVVRVSVNGVQLNIRVPKHSQPGDSFVFDIAKSELLRQQQQQQKGADVKHTSTLILDATPASASATSSSGLSLNTFYSKLGVAFGTALLIGLSILFGFMLGILYVTQPLGPNGELPPIISKAKLGGRTILQLQQAHRARQ